MNKFIFLGLLASLILFELSYIFSVPAPPIEITAEFVGSPNAALSALPPLVNTAFQGPGPVRVQGMPTFPQPALRYPALPVGNMNPSIINPLSGIPASQSDIRSLLQASSNVQGQNFFSPQLNQLSQVPQIQVPPMDVQQAEIQPSQVQAAAVDSVIVSLPSSTTNSFPQSTLTTISALSPAPVSTVLSTTNTDASYLFTSLDSTGFTASSTQSSTVKPTLDPTSVPSPVIPIAVSPTGVSSSSAAAVSSTSTAAPTSTSTVSRSSALATPATPTYPSTTSSSSVKSATQATPIVRKNAMVEDPSQPSGLSSLSSNSTSKNSLTENTFGAAPSFINSSEKKQHRNLFIALLALITLHFV